MIAGQLLCACMASRQQHRGSSAAHRQRGGRRSPARRRTACAGTRSGTCPTRACCPPRPCLPGTACNIMMCRSNQWPQRLPTQQRVCSPLLMRARRSGMSAVLLSRAAAFRTPLRYSSATCTTGGVALSACARHAARIVHAHALPHLWSWLEHHVCLVEADPELAYPVGVLPHRPHWHCQGTQASGHPPAVCNRVYRIESYDA